jgi:hypothetical protein
MTECDEILEGIFLHRPLPANALTHVRDCPRCHREAMEVARIADALAAPAPIPPSGLRAEILCAAAPLLAAQRAATITARRAWPAALAAALLPLPLVLVFDLVLAQGLHAVLSLFLPGALSTYVVFNFTAVTALVVALGYGAVPFVVHRQLALAREERFA